MSPVDARFLSSHHLPRLDDQLPLFEAMLAEQRQFRLHQLAELAEQLQPAGPATGLPAGAGADDPQREVAVKLAAAARRALADVEAALARLHAGEYGRCTSCRGQIPLERLEVLPQSAYCVSCQQRHEHLLG